jgi:hypothetical protein
MEYDSQHEREYMNGPRLPMELALNITVQYSNEGVDTSTQKG